MAIPTLCAEDCDFHVTAMRDLEVFSRVVTANINHNGLRENRADGLPVPVAGSRPLKGNSNFGSSAHLLEADFNIPGHDVLLSFCDG
jgi:hypothetical protein